MEEGKNELYTIEQLKEKLFKDKSPPEREEIDLEVWKYVQIKKVKDALEGEGEERLNAALKLLEDNADILYQHSKNSSE